MTLKIDRFEALPQFKEHFDAAPPEIKAAAEAALRKLTENPLANSLRLHKLNGYRNPSIHVIDVLSNHSWQISFELSGTTARLRRLSTHKELDRNP